MDETRPSYIRFMKYKWLFFAISLLVALPGLFSLARFGLRFSIDFTGGSILEIKTNQPSSTADITQAAAGTAAVLSVQSLPDNTYLLRLKPIDQSTADALVSHLDSQLEGGASSRRFETVGPIIGAELARKAIIAVVVASILIVLYISWSFRTIPRPYSSWKFGLSAIAALVHDILVVVGIFSLLGHFYHVEVDALFVTALLTVIGFSVHDTIVVFDRIRENLHKFPRAPFDQVVDFSLTETLGRSLNTSLTVILTLTALLLFGGDTIRWFVVALLVGIISGTYSSIFNASPLLVLWETKKAMTAGK